jgi:hypothetical protein
MALRMLHPLRLTTFHQELPCSLMSGPAESVAVAYTESDDGNLTRGRY